MPAWLVTTTAATPAPFSRRIASAERGRSRKRDRMIDVAHFFGQRPVPVDEDSGP